MVLQQATNWRSYSRGGFKTLSEETLTYLEKVTEAKVTVGETISIVFHKAKLKMRDELEIDLLKSINPELNKQLTVTEDEVVLTLSPPSSYQFVQNLHTKSIIWRWTFAYQLVQKVKQHHLNRLHPVICPSNILYDKGLIPHFLHYGVMESIPPYEKDEERTWEELKATIASLIDPKHSFESYLHHSSTLELSVIAKKIMSVTSYENLESLIEKNINKEEKKAKEYIELPKRKWKIGRYMSLSLLILLIPAIVYTVYAAFFKQPELQAYVESGDHFLQGKYSSVVSRLDGYEPEDMPYIVKYQLASSYIVNESLTEEQRTNVQNTVTLQSDERYFLYWIYIGRGMNEDAIDLARDLEDRDLIVFGLLKHREEIKADDDLSGEEKENQLEEIQREIDDYLQEQKEEQEAAEAEVDEEEQTDQEEATEHDGSQNQDASQQEEEIPTNEETSQQQEDPSSQTDVNGTDNTGQTEQTSDQTTEQES